MNLNKNIKKINNYKIRKNLYETYLDSMENNYFNNEKFKKILYKTICENKIFFNRYYFKSDVIKAKNFILNFLNTKKSKIIIGNGLDEIIFLICLIANKNIGSVEPTFSMYEKYTLLLNKNFFKFKLTFKKKITLNYKKLNIFIKKNNIEFFFLCYPNNPTGNIYSKKRMLSIFKKNSKCIFIIDETYYNYSKKSFLGYINKIKNIIILRTFSKIGFASLRIGYMLCNKKIYKIMNKVKLPYNLSILSLIIIPYVIKFYKKSNIVKKTLKQKKKLELFLKKKKIFFYNSLCNFFLLKIKKNLFNKITKKILVKKIKNLKNNYIYTRISIGNKKENNKLIKIINENS